MKIIQLIPNIAGGGAERLVVDLTNVLVKKHHVILLTLYDLTHDDLFSDQIISSVRNQSLGKQPGFDWKLVPKLYKVIKEIAPDIIHNHLRAFNYLMPSITFLKDIPIIHTVHNDAFKECHSGKIRYIRKHLFKRNNVVPVTISKKSRQSFEMAYPHIRNELIMNGRRSPQKSKYFEKVKLEINKYRRNEETRVFVNVARLHPQKNQLMLVKAFNRLIYDHSANAVLLIIGGGRNTEKSRKIHQQLQQAEQVHAHIHLLGERANATDYLHAGDYFCLSSLYEGMPITLIEAFATGCIPVCTPVGGISEMVAELDETLLAESVNEDDYVKALKYSMAISKDNQEKLKQQAVSLFEKKYSIKHCADRYVRLYRSLNE